MVPTCHVVLRFPGDRVPELELRGPRGWLRRSSCPSGGRTRRYGVLVVVDQIPFKSGDKVAFRVTVCGDDTGQTPAAEFQGVVSITADTTSASYAIPWNGVLDTVTEVLHHLLLHPHARRRQRAIDLARRHRPVLPSTTRRRCLRSGQLSRVGQILPPAAAQRVECPRALTSTSRAAVAQLAGSVIRLRVPLAVGGAADRVGGV